MKLFLWFLAFYASVAVVCFVYCLICNVYDTHEIHEMKEYVGCPDSRLLRIRDYFGDVLWSIRTAAVWPYCVVHGMY